MISREPLTPDILINTAELKHICERAENMGESSSCASLSLDVITSKCLLVLFIFPSALVIWACSVQTQRL